MDELDDGCAAASSAGGLSVALVKSLRNIQDDSDAFELKFRMRRHAKITLARSRRQLDYRGSSPPLGASILCMTSWYTVDTLSSRSYRAQNGNCVARVTFAFGSSPR